MVAVQRRLDKKSLHTFYYNQPNGFQEARKTAVYFETVLNGAVLVAEKGLLVTCWKLLDECSTEPVLSASLFWDAG